ncbi:MAG: amidase family protein [Oscillospiraceae bacterium]|nr:amidase family protein [Oscillospiraceae bacterium]
MVINVSYKAIISSSIMQKGKSATAGSKMLENFISPIDATVVENIEALIDVEIVGVGAMDEFGVGGLFGEPSRALADDGVVGIVASRDVDFALCNDYTGAISRAAAQYGLCYIHPTYGTVSRYGLIPAVSSIDQIGVLSKSPEGCFNGLKMIAGYNSKDGAMPVDYMIQAVKNDDEMVKRDVKDITVTELKPKFAEVYTQIMQIICCAEFSNNISRYDGVKYGYRAKDYNGLQEMYMSTRTEAFGEDVKLAAILGTMVLSHENYTKLYDKAMRLRRLIMDSMKFDTYDVVVGRGDDSNALILLSRLCGLPSITIRDCTYVANKCWESTLEAVCDMLESNAK